ncbi:DUF5412 domain-containing protein [Proteiniclasticum sp. C24MP]|uniref:DUF5412 domain-containing protein n=1 Tax=Proteiniclasticum sp. C24MP TaxID=3374101 RepID=UPI003754BF91
MRKVITVMLLIVLLLFIGVYYFFYDMSHFSGGTLIAEEISPDGTYTVRAYLGEHGATVANTVRGELVFNEMGRKPKNIYWNYREEEAVVYWMDGDTVVINGKELTVPFEIYDFRRDKELE